MLAVVLFAVAISVDGFLVGIAEGMRGIRVPVSTLIVINVVSAVVVFLSLSSGKYFADRLDPVLAKLIGSGILIALGGLMLKPLSRCSRQDAMSGSSSGDDIGNVDIADAKIAIEGSPNKGESTDESAAVNTYERETVMSKIVRMLQMIPNFLTEPATADLDSSGTLTPDEGFLLGIALAIDALGVGFGAGMAGISNALTPVVAGVTQCIFVGLGLALGRKMRGVIPVQMLENAPGGILIFLGAMRLK